MKVMAFAILIWLAYGVAYYWCAVATRPVEPEPADDYRIPSANVLTFARGDEKIINEILDHVEQQISDQWK